jgi:hypothetical protein
MVCAEDHEPLAVKLLLGLIGRSKFDPAAGLAMVESAFMAVVMPAKVVGQLNMKRWIKTFEDMGVTVRVFATPEPALAWLQSE